MKKSMLLVMSLLVAVSLICCGKGESTTEERKPNEGESVVETTEAVLTMNEDWEIVTREGHPRFHDGEELARTVWRDISTKKILFADSFDRYKDTNIITMDSMDGKLNSIEVYFQNFSTPITLTVDDVLPVISTYLPLEQMKDCYELERSFIAVPMEGEEGGTHYFMSYVLKNDAREGNPDLFYDVVIEIEVDKECVTMFRVFDRFPSWASRLEFNGYTEQVWDYDFFD